MLLLDRLARASLGALEALGRMGTCQLLMQRVELSAWVSQGQEEAVEAETQGGDPPRCTALSCRTCIRDCAQRVQPADGVQGQRSGG